MAPAAHTRLACAIFGHRRSRKAARLNVQTANYESQCVFCGAAMERIEHGRWIVIEQARQPG